jgi:hypothetical protein
MATGKIRIGLTSGTLVDMPLPKREYPVEFLNRIEEVGNQSNNIVVRLTGKEKQVLKLEYEYKSITEFNTLKSYCNKPYFYYCQIENSLGTVYFSGFAFLTISGVGVMAFGDDFMQGFSITIKETEVF